MGKKILKTISDLKAAEYNPRRITPEALKGLGYSLEEFIEIPQGINNYGMVLKKISNESSPHQIRPG